MAALDKALILARSVNGNLKASAIMRVAVAPGEAGDSNESAALMSEARQAAERISFKFIKIDIISEIIRAQARRRVCSTKLNRRFDC